MLASLPLSYNRNIWLRCVFLNCQIGKGWVKSKLSWHILRIGLDLGVRFALVLRSPRESAEMNY